MSQIIELFHQDFDTNICTFLSKQVLIAVKSFNMLLAENKNFFSYPLYSSVKGNLLNYSIEHCLFDSAFIGKVNYQVYQENVNSFGRSVLHLKTSHFQMTAAKTYKPNNLPTPAKYKLNYSKHNTGADGQLRFDFVNPSIVEPPYYALLTYGFDYIMQDCTHINLILPDSEFKNIVDNIDLLHMASRMSIVPKESEVTQTFAKLKPEFEKQIGQPLKYHQEGE